jgi:hypothetical protein
MPWVSDAARESAPSLVRQKKTSSPPENPPTPAPSATDACWSATAHAARPCVPRTRSTPEPTGQRLVNGKVWQIGHAQPLQRKAHTRLDAVAPPRMRQMQLGRIAPLGAAPRLPACHRWESDSADRYAAMVAAAPDSPGPAAACTTSSPTAPAAATPARPCSAPIAHWRLPRPRSRTPPRPDCRKSATPAPADRPAPPRLAR